MWFLYNRLGLLRWQVIEVLAMYLFPFLIKHFSKEKHEAMLRGHQKYSREDIMAFQILECFMPSQLLSALAF